MKFRVLFFVLLSNLFVLSSSYAQSFAPRVEVTTNIGSFTIQLDRLRAPLSVESFLGYVEQGFYENIIFHRVVHGFVIQAGVSSPTFEMKDAPSMVSNESGNGLANVRGSVGVARTQDPHSGNAQFYINIADNPSLNPSATRWGYAVFGEVISGMEVIDQIAERQTSSGGPFASDVPTDAVVILQARIINN
jgi:cyclophilin family peptidyl-prolyl cis-trans isomerase